MTGSIIERHGHEIIGQAIHYDDRPATWEQGDTLAGHRIDRRRVYGIINGELCTVVRWSQACSGCNEEFGASRGSGCSECGYQGRVRWGAYVPYPPTRERDLIARAEI